MSAFKFSSAHAKSVSASIETDKDGCLERVLTVETDLYLDVLGPSYNKMAVDDLMDEIKGKMGSDTFDRGVLKEIARSS